MQIILLYYSNTLALNIIGGATNDLCMMYVLMIMAIEPLVH